MAGAGGLREGTWEVGSAGTVTFALRAGSLVLEDVTPAPGWTLSLAREEPGRLEAEFRRGVEELEFEVGYANGVLAIELSCEIVGADPGHYDVGEAGSVEIAVEDGKLKLVEISTNPGWSMEVDEQEDTEIEVEFRRGALEWQFEAELNERGDLEIEIEMEIEGPYPAVSG